MSIRRAGAGVDTMPLAGSRSAMSGLAHCLADRWNAPIPQGGEAAKAAPADQSI